MMMVFSFYLKLVMQMSILDLKNRKVPSKSCVAKMSGRENALVASAQWYDDGYWCYRLQPLLSKNS
jgi:hypothetical protein